MIRLYMALDEKGFDRALVVQLSFIGKALSKLRESDCENVID